MDQKFIMFIVQNFKLCHLTYYFFYVNLCFQKMEFMPSENQSCWIFLIIWKQFGYSLIITPLRHLIHFIISYSSVGLVYLMYRAFESVCIQKPNTSRPANSERYLVCKGKRKGADSIAQYMLEINARLNQVRKLFGLEISFVG